MLYDCIMLLKLRENMFIIIAYVSEKEHAFVELNLFVEHAHTTQTTY